MRADSDKPHRVCVFMIEDCAVVARNINAPATGVFAMERMIVEKRMERLGLKEL